MTRQEFLTLLGLGTGAALLGCAGGCKKDEAAPSGIDFTLDLSAPANAALNTPGGYLVTNGVIVARTLSNAFVAVQRNCTHEGTTLEYYGNRGSDLFHCSNHGAEFDTSGRVVRQPSAGSASNLATYRTQVSGNSLRVYS